MLRPVVRPGDEPVQRHREPRSNFAHVLLPLSLGAGLKLPPTLPGWYLLDAPAVAVGVPEEDAPDQVEVFVFAGRTVRALVEDLDLAHVHAPLHQTGAGDAHVCDDQEHTVEVAGLCDDGSPTQVEMEQEDPGGVNWTRRTSSLIV